MYSNRRFHQYNSNYNDTINFSSCQSLTFLHIFILKYNDQKRILKPSGFCYFRGVFQSVTYFRGGVPRCVTKCDRGRKEVQLVKNSVTYFMDGPYSKKI